MKTILYAFLPGVVLVLFTAAVEDPNYADSLNRELKFSKNELRRLFLQTEIAQVMNDEDSAITILQTVLERADEMNEKHIQLAANIALGHVYLMDGTEPDTALHYLHVAEAMAAEIQDTLALAQSQMYEGEVWAIKSNPGKAATLYVTGAQVLQTNSQIENSVPNKKYVGQLGQIFNRQALLFMQQAQLDSARVYEKRAAAAFKLSNWGTDRAQSLAMLATIESKQHSHQEAIQSLTEALDVCTADDAPEISSNLSQLAMEYSAAGNFKMAEIKADSALLIANNINSIKGKAGAFEALAAIHQNSNDYKQALTFYDSAAVLNRQITAQQTSEKVILVQKKLQREASNISTAKALAGQQRRSNMLFVGIAVLLISVVVFLIAFTGAKRFAWVAKVLGAVSLLLTFELISLALQPVLENRIHHSGIYTMLILTLIGAILVAFHHRIEDFVKRMVHVM
jgi:tetratricopeptide (TPR) repeat protein